MIARPRCARRSTMRRTRSRSSARRTPHTAHGSTRADARSAGRDAPIRARWPPRRQCPPRVRRARRPYVCARPARAIRGRAADDPRSSPKRTMRWPGTPAAPRVLAPVSPTSAPVLVRGLMPTRQMTSYPMRLRYPAHSACQRAHRSSPWTAGVPPTLPHQPGRR